VQPEAVVSVATEMLFTAFLIALPLLMTAIVVGVTISVVQTVTGVQEMTLTFVPKIMGVGMALIIFMPWMKSLLLNFTREILRMMAGV